MLIGYANFFNQRFRVKRQLALAPGGCDKITIMAAMFAERDMNI